MTLPTYPRKSLPPRGGEKPSWLKVPLLSGDVALGLRRLMREHDLHTVCEEARCPNRAECWAHGTATFLLLGDICTRACGFCNIATGRPGTVDADEPERVARAAQTMGLRHVVLTAVTRDDLSDGGASIFAATVRAVRAADPGRTVEVLVPDFQGNWEALACVLDAEPDVLNHNLETVPRLYGRVRAGARFERSLELLTRVRSMRPAMTTKSGLMVGLGETRDELLGVFRDLRAVDVHILTVGQYLRPTAWHLPVACYYAPEQFNELRAAALAMGFRHVEAGPLVRSSYHAHEHVATR